MVETRSPPRNRARNLRKGLQFVARTCKRANVTVAQPAALPIKKFAAKYGVHPCTVWRAVRAGRLPFVRVGKRRLILPPVAQNEVPKKTGR